MNSFDDCEICGNVTASVTVRTTDSTTRVCGGCYTRHYDANEESTLAWEADFDDLAADAREVAMQILDEAGY